MFTGVAVPTLAATITRYYFKHFDELPEDKQFHFVSRLSSWSANPEALQRIERFRADMLPSSPVEFLRGIIDNPPAAKINAAKRRAPYFEKYPHLRGTMLALFRVRHLLFHYDVDIRQDLLRVTSLDTIYALSDALQHDSEAMTILSTYAINYIYLVEVILFPRGVDMAALLERVIASTSQLKNTPEDALLLIYLFTHCIIGQSNFYQTPVDTEKYPQYAQMLHVIEQLIAENFTTVNLDNKFEFLVCCRLAQFDTPLFDRIQAEALQSKSNDGDFLVDTLNLAGQSDKTSFADSEHRNVLYIMSCDEFQAASKSDAI